MDRRRQCMWPWGGPGPALRSPGSSSDELSLLNFPAALSMASDVWRQAAIGIIALVFLGEQVMAIYSTNYSIS